MSNIVIREANIDDLDSILEIEEKCFTNPWSREAFELEICNNLLAKYVVAVHNEKIIGYGGIWLIIDEGHITNVAVHPESRGKGIGNLIVEGLIDLCKRNSIERMTLEVRVSNNTAINLYKKYDFSECGIRPKYYSDTKEDALIMWKEI